MRLGPGLALACAVLLVQPGLAAAPAAPPAESGAAEQASAQAIVKNYKAFPRLTGEPRAVSRTLATLCRVSTPEEIARDGEGYGPHSLAWVHVYANEPAVAELAKTRRQFPVGAIIVKEKLGEQQGATGIGAMRKMPPGYDPEGGDWQYIYTEVSATPGRDKVEQGKLEKCRSCHMRAKERDHVYFRSGG